MSIKTFSVTLTDLGTYTLDVAAFDEKQASAIARQVLHEPAFAVVTGLSIKARETQATAIIAEPQPERAYRVKFWQRVLHDMRLSANDHREAAQRAEWLINDTGRLEFDTIDERVDGIVAEV